ncbi:hypothetical protein [Bacillus sp. BR3(2024)]|uniref:hypothetical protein n=1 Tax=Bacillus sp. BR3(2024) TaxID=3126755 RepID=UPI0031840FB6
MDEKRKMTKYDYWVSYVFKRNSGSDLEHGNDHINIVEVYSGIEWIREVEGRIRKKYNYKSVKIINFIPLVNEETEQVTKKSVIAARGSIVWFAEHMESKLKENDHKGGWEENTVDDLFEKLKLELIELQKELAPDLVPSSIPVWAANIIRECSDIANFAMMIADVTNRYVYPYKSPNSEEKYNI